MAILVTGSTGAIGAQVLGHLQGKNAGICALTRSPETARYGGDDLVVMEQRTKTMLPAWHALDLRLMFSRYQTEGAVATANDIARLTRLLGRTPRSYTAFAKDAAAQWATV